MINKIGNMFDDDADTIVIPVNLYGSMGAGLARYIALKHPDLHYWYWHAVTVKKVFNAGCVMVYDTPDRQYLLLPTKYHPYQGSNVDLIRMGVSKIADLLENCRLNTIALPAIGMGLGHINHDTVEEVEAHNTKIIDVINEYLTHFGNRVRFYQQ